MFEKDLSLGLLLDFYGDVLNEHTRSLLNAYYAEDLSLSEIAESEGISRQGVRQAIKKGEEELRFLEEKLGLSEKYRALQASGAQLRALSDAVGDNADPAVSALVREARRCADLITE